MKASEKIFPVIGITLWLLVFIYAGTGPYMKVALEEAALIDSKNTSLSVEDDLIVKLFCWTDQLPSMLLLLITACSFGVIGAVAMLVKMIAMGEKKLEEVRYLSYPLLGFLTGFVILGISVVIPTVLVSGQEQLRPTTLVFLSFFAGMYAENFFSFFVNIINKLFPKS